MKIKDVIEQSKTTGGWYSVTIKSIGKTYIVKKDSAAQNRWTAYDQEDGEKETSRISKQAVVEELVRRYLPLCHKNAVKMYHHMAADLGSGGYSLQTLYELMDEVDKDEDLVNNFWDEMRKLRDDMRDRYEAAKRNYEFLKKRQEVEGKFYNLITVWLEDGQWHTDHRSGRIIDQTTDEYIVETAERSLEDVKSDYINEGLVSLAQDIEGPVRDRKNVSKHGLAYVKKDATERGVHLKGGDGVLGNVNHPLTSAQIEFVSTVELSIEGVEDRKDECRRMIKDEITKESDRVQNIMRDMAYAETRPNKRES